MMKAALVKKPLHILCLEDDAADWELMQQALAADGLACRFEQVQSRAEFEMALKRDPFDLIISDYSLPAYNGADALVAAQKLQPATPFILLSGTVGEER